MELWNDPEDNTQPQENAGRGRTRRLTEPATLAILRQWLLDGYVADYARSLAGTRIFRRCYFIDALGIATKGRNAARHPAVQPICTLAQVLLQESRPIALNGLLLAFGSSKRKDARLGEREAVSVPKESGILNASWLEAAPSILQEVEQSPTIFLLNPFGHTLFTNEDVTALYKRTAPTELCLFLSHKQLETLFLTAIRSPAYAILVTAVLRTDRWKALSTRNAERKKTLHALIDLFADSMKRHFVLPIQLITLPVLMRPGVVEEMPCTLVFATRRQDSFASMNNALCHYRRGVYAQRHHGVLNEEWFEMQYKQRVERDQQRLEAGLVQQGRAQQARRWPELRQQQLAANFGNFLVAEYDAILHRLLQNGVVRCEWRRPPSADEGERLPANDDTLRWTEEKNLQKERGGTRGKH